MTSPGNWEILLKPKEYDGEVHDRDGLDGMLNAYHSKHQSDLDRLSELRTKHDEIAVEMTQDLAESKTAWDYLKGMASTEFQTNFRGLLEKIPILNEFVSERPLSDLLREKVEVAERRVREVGQYLIAVEQSIQGLQADTIRLNKKVVVAAENEEKAAQHVIQLKIELNRIEKARGALEDKASIDYRKMGQQIQQLKQSIWQEGAKLRLYSSAEERIASIVSMNNNFLEILNSLHANMQQLHDAGNEVLDELRGNLSGLATAAEAAELSVEMQKAMQSPKKSVNHVAILASNTSLYLTQNVERMTSELKVYDRATQELIETNLEAEKEMHEDRVDDTLALAEREFQLMQTARRHDP